MVPGVAAARGHPSRGGGPIPRTAAGPSLAQRWAYPSHGGGPAAGGREAGGRGTGPSGGAYLPSAPPSPPPWPPGTAAAWRSRRCSRKPAQAPGARCGACCVVGTARRTADEGWARGRWWGRVDGTSPPWICLPMPSSHASPSWVGGAAMANGQTPRPVTAVVISPLQPSNSFRGEIPISFRLLKNFQ